ncbi:hypothetical protein ACIGHF_04655 [Stenotrophomonas sp. NPDC077464]|uniref:hypothetical protein n=1 Tax=unclassified Stenotrophomonas TaxID=196198 RepID=UPI0037D73B00
MHFPNLLTALVGGAAAFHGTRAAPVETSRSGAPLPLSGIGNTALPPGLATSLQRNYAACQQLIEGNPRMFGALSDTGAQSLCVAQAGLDAGFGRALQARPSEIALLREGLHRLAGSRSRNPLAAPATAEHPLQDLRWINFQDYRHSASTRYADQLERQVAVLRAHIPPAQRGSLDDARHASQAKACRQAWKRQLPVWVRTEIAERSTLVTMREVGHPESISRAQADALRADLAQMRFGRTAMKQRMHEDALVALVEGSAVHRSDTPG